jgi:CDP-glucose 4,6-dehydratase
MRLEPLFFKGKKVFVTGHTGFKGSWLCKTLAMTGADVTGYALDPPTNPALFELAGIGSLVHSVIGDVRSKPDLERTFFAAKPEIVFHLAAQPLVAEGYKNPAGTYETNVMGTVNLLECARKLGTVRSFLNVTTDKVYENAEWEWGYRESDRLGGRDPYSSSKSCSELAASCYRQSFPGEIASISTARAGNVIGGGDFAERRIIPDCVRSASAGREIIVRNPDSVRPYQHVLETVSAYLAIAELQYISSSFQDSYNIGPDDGGCASTGELASLFCAHWGNGASWATCESANTSKEAQLLKLDSSRIKARLQWKPQWGITESVKAVCDFSKALLSGENVGALMEGDILRYFLPNGGGLQ